VHGRGELIGAFEAATRGRVEALIVIEDGRHPTGSKLALAATHSLAVVSQYRAFAEAG
jgi:hypothetical protein